MNWVCLLVEFSGFETKYNPGDGVELKILDCYRTTSQRQEEKHISRHVLSPKTRKLGFVTLGTPKPLPLKEPRTLETCTQVHLPITGQGPSSPTHCQSLDTMSRLPNPTPMALWEKDAMSSIEAKQWLALVWHQCLSFNSWAGIGYLKDQECPQHYSAIETT